MLAPVLNGDVLSHGWKQIPTNACMRACVRACVRACERACVCVHVFLYLSTCVLRLHRVTQTGTRFCLF